MNQCVPSWELDESPTHPKLDYEVAELTWENGQLAMHGLGPRRVPNKPAFTSSPTKYTWDKPHAGGTLESIVNQATYLPHGKTTVDSGVGELVPWFNNHHAVAVPTSATTSAAATMTMDALVPCSNNRNEEHSTHVSKTGISTCTAGGSARVGSCSGAATFDSACVAAHEWSSCRDPSVSGSATFGRDSRQVSLDTCEIEFGMGGFTSTSMGSPGNTSSGELFTKSTSGDDHDSVCHSRPQRQVGDEEAKKKARGKSSVTNKRGRAAAVHNQSERKRRDRINQRIKILQKLVPNSSKTDKASMLDEVIEYLKQLQAQVQMMSRMNMSPMMLPMAIQQHLQMSMLAPMMGMGMGLGLGLGMGVMDLNTITRSNFGGNSPVLHPAAFMPLASWDGSGDRLPTPTSLMPNPLATFLSSQSQPMTMEAYCRLAALYKQMHQPPASGSKN